MKKREEETEKNHTTMLNVTINQFYVLIICIALDYYYYYDYNYNYYPFYVMQL